MRNCQGFLVVSLFEKYPISHDMRNELTEEFLHVNAPCACRGHDKKSKIEEVFSPHLCYILPCRA